MEIHTERLRLRELEMADWEAIFRYESDPEVRQQLLWWQRDEKAVREYVKNSMSYSRDFVRSHFAFAVMLPGQNELIGSCNLDDAHKGSISASVGWTFDKRFWGQGYATEAGRALLRLAFERQQVEKVLAECFASNIASRRVMEKLQMRPLTILGGGEMPATANFFTNPHIHYIITRTEWLQQQGAKYEQS